MVQKVHMPKMTAPSKIVKPDLRISKSPGSYTSSERRSPLQFRNGIFRGLGDMNRRVLNLPKPEFRKPSTDRPEVMTPTMPSFLTGVGTAGRSPKPTTPRDQKSRIIFLKARGAREAIL